jgi:flagellar assembly protein FliH
MATPPAASGGMTAQEMQTIFDEAERDGFAQGHKEGVNKGHAEGYAAGKQQGQAEVRAQLLAEQQRFSNITQQLLAPLAAQEHDLEQLLLDTICSLTQSVIERELITDSSHILELVKTAIAALPIGHKNVRISLHPNDIAAIEAYAQEQQLEWKFLANTQLQPGGCLVETLESRVDFSVSSRLQQVLEQFLTKQLAAGEGDIIAAPKTAIEASHPAAVKPDDANAV